MNIKLPRHGDELELVATEIDDDGLAVARVSFDASGLVASGIASSAHTQDEATPRRRMRVKIRGAVPGDRVRVRVESRVRDDLYVRVIDVLEPSADRITPRCQHARYHADRPYCGGCTLQAVSYDRQLTLKAERVRRAFDVAGVRAEVRPTIAAPTLFGHRHKMELSFAADPTGEVALGLHPPGYKWEVVSLVECALMSPATSAFLPAAEAVFKGLGLRSWDPRRDDSFLRNFVVREGKRTSDLLLELITTPRDPVETRTGLRPAHELVADLFHALAAAATPHGVTPTSLLWTVQDAERGRPTQMNTIVLKGHAGLADALVIRDRRIDLDIDARAFFQPHPRAAEGLVHEVLTRLGEARVVLDLYCGTGTLALSLAPFVGRVIGVEIVALAIANARANALRNHLDNATFIVGDVGVVLADPKFKDSLDYLDAVLLDPPRSGLSPQALTAVTQLGAARLVYISCKPESLARDIRALQERGYRLEGPAQPVDLFPQSHHIETVVSLVR